MRENRLFGRRAAQRKLAAPPNGDAAAVTTPSLLGRAEELVARHQTLEAIAELTEANRRAPDHEVERTLARLRQTAWDELDPGQPSSTWPPLVPDLFPGENGIPEITGDALTAPLVHSAIAHHGALVVRGLVPADECARLRDAIDGSWDAIERFRASKQRDAAWFDPMDTADRGLDMASRMWVIKSGTSYVPDSPRLLYELLETFDRNGVKRIVTEYFGERPALSLVKLAQRRLAPDATGGWHQDAAVYAEGTRTLNVWMPVTRCGDVAPGLEMWPRRLDHLVPTVGTKGVNEFRAVIDDVAALTADVPPVRPCFDPGDAAIFDQYLLHQTSASPDFTEPRYGFESWFFAPSTFPEPRRWIPVVY